MLAIGCKYTMKAGEVNSWFWNQGDLLASAIDFDDQTASLDNAFAVAEYFDIKPKQANEIVAEVSNAVADWRKEAKRLGVPARKIDRIVSAFEH